MQRGASRANEMQFESKSEELKQAVNKQRPFSDETRTVVPLSPEKHVVWANGFHTDISQE